MDKQGAGDEAVTLEQLQQPLSMIESPARPQELFHLEKTNRSLLFANTDFRTQANDMSWRPQSPNSFTELAYLREMIVAIVTAADRTFPYTCPNKLGKLNKNNS